MRNEDIKHKIELAYLHEENNNKEAVKKINNEIKELLKKSKLIT